MLRADLSCTVSQHHRQRPAAPCLRNSFMSQFIPSFQCLAIKVEASRKPEAERRKGEEETCPFIF